MNYKRYRVFASTVIAALQTERTAYQGESFAFIYFSQDTNTPPMLLLSIQIAHLGGFFFNSPMSTTYNIIQLCFIMPHRGKLYVEEMKYQSLKSSVGATCK